MRNKFKIILLLFISFSFISNVDAGVCSNRAIYSSSSTCNNKSYDVKITNHYINDKQGSYFLYPGYLAEINGNDAMAVCLDPGLVVPEATTELLYLREMYPESTSFDNGIYNMYKYFYNNLLYAKSIGSLNDNFIKHNKAYFQYALRILTYANGWALVNGAEVYHNDMANFQTCSNYIDSTLTKGTLKPGISYCYGGLEKEVENYYKLKDQAHVDSKYKTEGNEYLWNWSNPLNITVEEKNVTNDAGINLHRYEFNVSFDNGTSKFFDGLYSKGLSYGSGSTYFNMSPAVFNMTNLSINGVSCKELGCYDYSRGSSINDANYKGNETFIVEITQEQYEQYKQLSKNGELSVKMDYSYNHPLNIENLFIVREKIEEKLYYQRMLIFYDYLHVDSISTVGEEVIPKCQHTTDGYIDGYGNKVSTLSEFLNSCNCENVNTTLLTPDELILFNDPLVCDAVVGAQEIEKKFEGGIKACNGINDSNAEYKSTLSDNYEDYELKYTKVESLNDYCTETCVETININNLKGKYTTKAGMYFEFSEYPNLVANKKCVVDIDYTKWLNAYQYNLQKLVEAYDAWKGAEGAEENYTVSPNNDCNWQCDMFGKNCEYKSKNRKHYFVYQLQKASGTKVVNSGQTKHYSATCCGSTCSFDSYSYMTAFQSLLTNREAIVHLKSELKTCNKRLFEGENSTAKGYYKFNQDLNYYYEQTYSKNNQTVRNDSRMDFGGLNDSEFKLNSNWQDPTKDDNNKYDGYNKQYDSFNESGVFPDEIFTFNTDPTRTVEYEVNYSHPSVNKGIKNYKAEVEDITGLNNEIIKKNYIKLGYKYDTDVSAVAKNNNRNYYSFSALGDDNGSGALFNYFKNQDGNNSDNFITRECVYEITNELIDTSIINDSKLNISYRMVDAANIDPNNRLISGEGFKNWLTEEAKAVKNKIEADAIGNNTYNPDNLEYSFELDSTILQEIREYNKEKGNYSDFTDYVCDDGNKCKSKFVSNYALKDSNKLKGIGRDSWKKYEKNSTNGKCYIDNELVKCP